tara:strand:+ start:1734 stop:2780 length:1047 start_codon:yes stop_codon:yes gene_type:complete
MSLLLRLVRLLREITTDVYRAILRSAAYAAALFRSRRIRIVETIEGDQNLAKATKVAIYANFDANGQVHSYVHRQVEALANTGFCVVFVTNSTKLDPNSIALLKPHVGQILCRKNIGYDFGAYKDGILSIKQPESLEALLIVNDSVYGPFKPLNEILNSDANQHADVLAITDSWEIRYHLQSYFILFNQKTLAHSEFWKFWTDLRYINNKGAVVRHYEIGLTRLLLKLRLRCEALYPYQVAARMMYEELGAVDLNSKSFNLRLKEEQDYIETMLQSLSAGIPLNGSHFLWQKLVLEMGCPFVKRELLAVNPMKVPNLIKFEESLKQVSDYDFDLIREHLKVINRMRFL